MTKLVHKYVELLFIIAVTLLCAFAFTAPFILAITKSPWNLLLYLITFPVGVLMYDTVKKVIKDFIN